jgi:predicted ATPase
VITSVRLQNWTSFGAEQTAPLEAITVLVGANNSGKSNFLRAFQTVDPGPAALHRPTSSPATLVRGVIADLPAHTIAWDFAGTYDRSANMVESLETVSVDGARVVESAWTPSENRHSLKIRGALRALPGGLVVAPHMVRHLVGNNILAPNDRELLAALMASLYQSGLVHLKADVIRQQNPLSPAATIGSDGSQLAALIARWTLEGSDKLDEYNDILRRCLPEMKRIHAPPAAQSGQVRLLFEQRDRERFDASEVSDGVILFAALIAHAVEAPENGLVLIEEPERGLHPRRLVELLDILRTCVEKRKTQFILATHSAALLSLLRDEPEAILLFRRTDTGTEIRRLSDVPELAESLTRADPGELLASGAFNEAYGQDTPDKAAE